MANADKAFGFIPVRSEGKQERVRVYKKDASTEIFAGDAVKMAADGEVEVAGTSGDILGVAAEYRAAAATEIAVYDDPDQVFETQCDGDFALADVGQNAVIVAGSGDSTLKISGHEIDSTFATAATHQFKILGLAKRPDNAVGSYARVLVKPNSHIFKSGTGGI